MTVIDRRTAFENLQGLVDESGLARCAEALYDDESVVRATNPLGEFRGVNDIVEGLWSPLIRAMRGLERRPLVFVAQDGPQGDTGLDAPKVATFGHLVGEFVGPWCGIEPTGSTVFLRFAEIHEFESGRVVRTTLFVDVIDLLLQCGRPVFPAAPGREILWPGPRFDVAAPALRFEAADDETTYATLDVVRRMQHDLHDDASTREQMLHAHHLRHWSPTFSWFGPAGIGTCRGADGFVDHHQLPFRRALPDRVGGGITKGHFAKFADGPFAVTAGWPSVRGTHLGDGWLGLDATGRSIDLRVTDFYSVGRDGLIVDNWVMIDLLHLCEQLDIPTGLCPPTSVVSTSNERNSR